MGNREEVAEADYEWQAGQSVRSRASYLVHEVLAMLRADVFGESRELIRDAPVFFSAFLHVAVSHQILQFVVRPKTKHFFPSAYGLTLPEVCVSEQKEWLEFKPRGRGKDRGKFLDQVVWAAAHQVKCSLHADPSHHSRA